MESRQWWLVTVQCPQVGFLVLRCRMYLNQSIFTRNFPLEHQSPLSIMVPHISSLPHCHLRHGSKYGADASLFSNLWYGPGDMVENHGQAKGWVSLANSALCMRLRSSPNFTQVSAKHSWDSLVGRNQRLWVEEGLIRELLSESSWTMAPTELDQRMSRDHIPPSHPEAGGLLELADPAGN